MAVGFVAVVGFVVVVVTFVVVVLFGVDSFIISPIFRIKNINLVNNPLKIHSFKSPTIWKVVKTFNVDCKSRKLLANSRIPS